MSEPEKRPVPFEAIGALSEFDADELKVLGRFGSSMEVGPGQKVINENDHHDCFYLILSGKLRVYRRKDGFETRLAELGKGEVIGEMNFLDFQSASATVQAAGGAALWRMSREEFNRFVENHPRTAIKLLLALAATVTQRLRRTIRKLHEEGQALGEGWW